MTALLVASLLLAAAPATLHVVPDASEVVFHMQTTWHGVEGRTRAIKGTLTTGSGDILKDGMISVEIEAARLDTGNSRRDRTMKETYLETAAHPAIIFVSTGPPAGGPASGDKGASLVVPGDLTIHGVKRAVKLPVVVRREGESWVVTGEITVRLSEHGIADPSLFINKVQDEVKVTLSVKLSP